MSASYAPRRLSPQLRQPSTTRAMMVDVMVALTPALGMAIFFFGLRALALTAVSVVSCVALEALYRLLTRQRQSVDDLSACVTGLLLALSLPASAPYWVPVMGAAFAIVVVKQFYGGLGRNFMNPALAGRMLAGTLPLLMTTWPQPLQKLSLTAVDAVSSATPMAYLHEGTLPPQPLDIMLLGQRGGCMGEVSAFMLLLGLIYLLLRRVISPRVPLSYLGTVAAISLTGGAVQLGFTLTLVPLPGVGMAGYVAGAVAATALELGLCLWQAVRAIGLEVRPFQWMAAPGLAAALAGLTGNLLFQVLKDSGLAPVPAGLITLAFALVLYLAALQAQGVRAREVLRLDW